jgi:tRNA(Ile)-lysidine synthase
MSRPPAVARVLERVTATVRHYEMFLPGQTVLASVSGGPDSVCLLYSLHGLRRLLRIKLEVFHLDHRIRRDSGKDAEYVRRLAGRLELLFHPRVCEFEPKQGESIEAWGRAMRMYYSAEVRRETGAERLAEGHTLDDQAETVLIALIRGGGLDALGGIEPALGGEVQPLIDVRRTEVEAFCRALRLRPRRDPTNMDTRLLRNAVRLKVLPAIERSVGREVRATLARTADTIRQDEHFLKRQAFEAVEELVEEQPGGFGIDPVGLLTVPRPIAARIIRDLMYRLKATPTQEAIEAVLDLAAGRPGRRRDLAGGLVASRDREYVSLSRTSPESRV